MQAYSVIACQAFPSRNRQVGQRCKPELATIQGEHCLCVLHRFHSAETVPHHHSWMASLQKEHFAQSFSWTRADELEWRASSQSWFRVQ